MPKKSGKKKKGKKGKKKKEFLPLVYNIPAYEDPDFITPSITVKIQLANPNVKELNMELELPLNTRLEYIRKRIIESHKGAMKDVFFYKDRSDNPEVLDMTKNLDNCGIEIAAVVTLYYDFKPYSNPVLV